MADSLETDSGITRARELIRESRYVVALTGAGISTPSGIPDFRSPGRGLWEKANPVLLASIHSFRLRPRAFYGWLRPLSKAMRDAVPNSAHLSLARLERCGVLRRVLTQNVDGLHQKAGSDGVLELHGNAREAICLKCRSLHTEIGEMIDALVERGEIPRCPRCGAILKPNAILYGEALPARALLEARIEAERCNLMLVVGSSLVVSPAADLPVIARRNGAKMIIVNAEETPLDSLATVILRGDVAELLPQIVGTLEQVG